MGSEMSDIQHKARGAGNFHEAFSSGSEVPPPSPRSTGLVFAVIAIIVAVIFRGNSSVAIPAVLVAATLAAMSFFAPGALQPLNLAWFKFGMLLHRIVNPVVMFLMFTVAFLPMGFAMRLFYDPLRFKRGEKLETYWLEPDAAEQSHSSMKNQF